MSFASLSTGQMIGLAGGAGVLSQIGSALIGSNAAGNATQQALEGQTAGLTAEAGGVQGALAALSPYSIMGLTDADLLQYGLTGALPSAGSYQNLLSQIPSITGGTAPTDLNSAISTLQSWISSYPGWAAQHPNAAQGGSSYAAAQSLLTQLQQAQQQGTAATNAQNAINTTGMQPGQIYNMLTTPFNYNPATDPNLANASTFANNEIASQFAAQGGAGSGAQASAIAQELAGTLEPTYYNQAYQNWEANYPGMATNVINALESNTGGAGQQVAGQEGNLLTGYGTQAAGTLTGMGNTLASGTLGQANAYTNALTGIGTQANSLLGMGMNYQNQQTTQNLLAQIAANQNNYGGYTFGNPNNQYGGNLFS